MTASTADAPWVDLPSLERAVLPGLTPTEGTCTVSIRKDPRTADGVIVGSAGTVKTTARTIEVDVTRLVVRAESGPTGRVGRMVAPWTEIYWRRGFAGAYG